MLTLCLVAPYTGAWIEIDMEDWGSVHGDVAPYTGAWIEIDVPNSHHIWKERRTLHGCVD